MILPDQSLYTGVTHHLQTLEPNFNSGDLGFDWKDGNDYTSQDTQGPGLIDFKVGPKTHPDRRQRSVIGIHNIKWSKEEMTRK